MPVFTSSIELSDNYPTIEPSLRLNFAQSRSLDPRVTFTRESVGTYVGRDGLIKTAGNDEARFDHDPVTLESLGLLIEEERTNYCGNSEMLANWSFGVGTDTFTASSGDQLSANPDGSSPAYLYSPSSTSGHHRFNRAVTLPTLDTNYVISLFVKRVTAGSVSNLNRYIELEATGNWNSNSPGTGQTGTNGGSAVTFDMENLVVESETDNLNGYVGDPKIEDYGNGWYRLSYVFNPGTGSSFTGQIWWGHPATFAGDTGGETGNGNPSFYFWGASVENGSIITSHIPTPENSSVTREADYGYINNVDTKDWYSIPEGTVCFEHTTVPQSTYINPGYPAIGFGQANSGDSAVSIQYFITKNDNGSNYLVRNGSGNDIALIDTNNALESNRNLGAKVAFVYKKDDYALARNGLLMGTDTTGGDIPTAGAGPYMLIFGSNALSVPSNQLNAHIKYLHYYPKRLTDAELLTITS